MEEWRSGQVRVTGARIRGLEGRRLVKSAVLRCSEHTLDDQVVMIYFVMGIPHGISSQIMNFKCSLVTHVLPVVPILNFPWNDI